VAVFVLVSGNLKIGVFFALYLSSFFLGLLGFFLGGLLIATVF